MPWILDDKGNKNSLTIHKCINMWTYSFQMKVERREKEITFGSHHHQNHYNSSASVPGPCNKMMCHAAKGSE